MFIGRKSYRLLLLPLLVALSLAYSGCKKSKADPGSTPGPTLATEIYAAGTSGDNVTGLAMFWKNGTSTTLSNVSSSATAIAVSGNDIYITGSKIANVVYMAMYWKNNADGGTAVSSSGPALASGIALVGNDIYVSGYEGKGPTYVATYWKNGVAVHFGGTEQSMANTIKVVGKDVYVGGTEYLPGHFIGTIWKNGSPIRLTINTSSEVNDLAIVGNDVYAVGVDNGYIANVPNTANVATYWKNGIIHHLSDTHLSSASAIGVIGSDIYIVGRQYKNSRYYGTLWKNGKELSTLYAGPNDDTFFTSIAVFGKELYIGGYDGIAGAGSVWKWENDKFNTVFTTEPLAIINGIFVK